MSNYKLTQGLKGRTITINIEDWGIGHGREMDQLLESMGQWCQESKCGKRMSWDQFFFKTQQQANLFILRWQ